HQLHAHEHDDRVAPHQDAHGADGEHDRREHDVVHRVHELSSSRCSSPLEACASGRPPDSGIAPIEYLMSSGTPCWSSGLRAASTGLIESSETDPSGSSAGMSMALCRA